MSNQRTSAWLRGCIVVIALCCLLPLAGFGAGVAIQRGMLHGPEFHVEIGRYSVIAFTTEYPDCHPFSGGCVVGLLHPPGTLPSFYTIWFVTVNRVPIPGGVREAVGGRRVLKLRVAP